MGCRVEQLPAVSIREPERLLALVEGVTTRICHDLAGLVGSLDGLTALARDDTEAAALAEETAHRLSAHVRLMRAAWGGDVEALEPSMVKALAYGLPGAERLQIDCGALSVTLTGGPARLSLCLLIVAAGAMPRGGRIALGGGADGLFLELEGRSAAVPSCLGRPSCLGTCATRELPVALCNVVALSLDWCIAVEGNAYSTRDHLAHVKVIAGPKAW